MTTEEDTPKKKTPREKAFALLPTLLTLGNAVCGFAAITILAGIGPVLDAEPVAQELIATETEAASLDLDKPENSATTAQADLEKKREALEKRRAHAAKQMQYAALAIFFAMLFDALDGSAARLTNQTSEFGAMLDSLCDVVSFGVAPAFMMLMLTDPRNDFMGMLGDFKSPIRSLDFLWGIAALYMACAILRLARFNVETDEEDSHEGFSGLPSPAAAGVIASFPIGVMSIKKLLTPAGTLGEAAQAEPSLMESIWQTVLPALAVMLPFVTLATAVLMVSRIPYPHVFNQILRGNRGRKQLLQLVFTLALVFQVRGMAVPVILCWFAFAGPTQYAWRKYVKKLPKSAPAT